MKELYSILNLVVVGCISGRDILVPIKRSWRNSCVVHKSYIFLVIFYVRKAVKETWE